MTEDEIYNLILPVWKSAAPSYEAQVIRSRVQLPNNLSDNLPDYVWQIADIAAQIAFNEANYKTTPSDANSYKVINSWRETVRLIYDLMNSDKYHMFNKTESAASTADAVISLIESHHTDYFTEKSND